MPHAYNPPDLSIAIIWLLPELIDTYSFDQSARTLITFAFETLPDVVNVNIVFAPFVIVLLWPINNVEFAVNVTLADGIKLASYNAVPLTMWKLAM